MITFAVEPWLAIRDEMAPLWKRHHAEVSDRDDRAEIALAPSWARYDRDAEAGALHVLVARSDGEMIL